MWTLQTPDPNYPRNNDPTPCFLPDGKLRHRETLQSSEVASWTHEVWFVLYYHKHILTPTLLQTVFPVAENLLCVATGETTSYAAIYMGIYTIYTVQGKWHPRKHNSFQAAVVSLVLRCFLSFRTCFAAK